MMRTLFASAVVFLCSSGAAEQPSVVFISPCECQGFHGKNRWVTKTDSAPIPLDKSAIQSVTPSQIYQWEGLGQDVELTWTSEERMPAEQKWCALTGRVVDLKVEADGDIHLALQDASGGALGSYLNVQDLACLEQMFLAMHPSFHAPNMLAHCSVVDPAKQRTDVGNQ